jgi:hypothetical protein
LFTVPSSEALVVQEALEVREDQGDLEALAPPEAPAALEAPVALAGVSGLELELPEVLQAAFVGAAAEVEVSAVAAVQALLLKL